MILHAETLAQLPSFLQNSGYQVLPSPNSVNKSYNSLRVQLIFSFSIFCITESIYKPHWRTILCGQDFGNRISY